MSQVYSNGGVQSPMNSKEMAADVEVIFTKKHIDAFGTTLQMDKFAESIDIPAGMNGMVNPDSGDVRNIRMEGKDDIARYLMYGDTGLMGRNATAGDTGLTGFNPYHAGIGETGGDADFSFDGTGALPLITRDPSKYEIGLNDDIVFNFDRQLNEHIPPYWIDGFIKRFGDMAKIDNWVKLMLPSKRNIQLIEDQAITAATMIDMFYRRNVLQTASQHEAVPVTLNVNATYDIKDSGWSPFTSGIANVVEQLGRFKAKRIKSMVTGSVNVGSETLESRYRIMYHPDQERFIKTIPGFVLVKYYAKPSNDPMELGSVGNVAFVELDSIAANLGTTPIVNLNRTRQIAGGTTVASTYPGLDSDTIDPSITLGGQGYSDVIGAGSRFTRYNFLILSEKAYGMLKMRGTHNFKTHIVQPDKAESGDRLNLAGSYGWTAFAGFIMMRPTHVWRLPVDFTYVTTPL